MSDQESSMVMSKAGKSVDASHANEDGFRAELQSLINRYSMENGSNTPDFLLADYLFHALQNFNATVNARERLRGLTSGGE